MIYTVALNPSINSIVRLDSLALGSTNRMTSDDKSADGKGVNVSRILKRLDIENTATGPIGGFTGRFVKDGLVNGGIATKFVEVSEDIRINVKVKAGEETEIDGADPHIPTEKLEELEAILVGLPSKDTVVFAGSAPGNLGNQVYNTLIPIAKKVSAEVVCDFEGQTLLDALNYQPFLVKPNSHELADIFGAELNGLANIEKYAHEILAKGAKNVIISMAGGGALLVTPEATYFAKPIKGTVRNFAGAGDFMVVGFIGEYVRSGDPIEALKWGVACGTAITFSDDLAAAEFVKETYQKVEVEKIWKFKTCLEKMSWFLIRKQLQKKQ